MKLKIMVVEETTLEDLFLARNELQIIDNSYQDLKLPTPNWIIDKMEMISTEINGRIRADLVKRLREARARREALRTPDEKRTTLDTEIAELESKLK